MKNEFASGECRGMMGNYGETKGFGGEILLSDLNSETFCADTLK